MPIYEYECGKCGARFEMLVSSSIKRVKRVKCEKCGSAKVKKLISTFSAGPGACSTTGGT